MAAEKSSTTPQSQFASPTNHPTEISSPGRRSPPQQPAPITASSAPSNTDPTTQPMGKWLSQIVIHGHLVLWSILGVLARLGMIGLTEYPNAPVSFGVLWANVAGSFIMGFLLEERVLFVETVQRKIRDTGVLPRRAVSAVQIERREEETARRDITEPESEVKPKSVPRSDGHISREDRASPGEMHEEGDDAGDMDTEDTNLELMQSLGESEGRGGSLPGDSAQTVQLADFVKAKKTIPLYIGLATGFCGSFTSFSTFVLDAFLAAVNQLPSDSSTHVSKALRSLNVLANLVVTNGQFRKLLKDAGILFRDIASDAATTASRVFRPKAEDLAQIDEPAEDNVWYSEPDISGFRTRARNMIGQSRLEARELTDNLERAAAENLSAPQSPQRRRLSGKEIKKKAIKIATRKPTDKAIKRQDSRRTKSRKEQMRKDAKEYLQRKVPKSRQESIIFRLKKILQECQHNGDYRVAVTALLDLGERYKHFALNLAEDSQETLRESHDEAPIDLKEAEYEIKLLIERFANGTSLDGLIEAVHSMCSAAHEDEDLLDWFSDMNGFIRSCLLNPGYILEDDCSDDWEELYSIGHALLRTRYKQQTDRIADEIKFIAQQFDEDEQNAAFAKATKKVFKSLGEGEDGHIQFKPHLVKDLFEVFLPSLLSKISYIPLPRIEFSSTDFDVIVENLVLESDNFTPNTAQWRSETKINWGRKSLAQQSQLKNKNALHQVCEIFLSGIQFDLRGVAYHVNRKTGFLPMCDSGIADLLLPGEGLAVKITLAMASTSPEKGHAIKASNSEYKWFQLQTVSVDVSRLEVNIVESTHKVLHHIFRPLVIRELRNVLKETAERLIREKSSQLDALLWKIHQNAVAYTTRARELNRHPPGKLRRYAKATRYVFRMYRAHRRREHGRESENYSLADSTTGRRSLNRALLSPAIPHIESAKYRVPEGEKRTRVSWTVMENSLFPDIKLPDAKGTSVSSKAAEYKELAHKGERWTSPVFSIGSASRSAQLPAPTRVMRKTPIFRTRTVEEEDEHGDEGEAGTESEEQQQMRGANPRTATATPWEDDDGESTMETFVDCE
ncbi:putative protein C32A11.02c [Ceratocystis platani]|uniref:Uncharacterized protein n=1 Tax=Ceratocystis fimbriata f. sp. platani TaxID=88771 RepID=A0A0F8B444_CERFI|nr:putative protein C32A11.02c [Ceratocystis platani]